MLWRRCCCDRLRLVWAAERVVLGPRRWRCRAGGTLPVLPRRRRTSRVRSEGRSPGASTAPGLAGQEAVGVESKSLDENRPMVHVGRI